jgi:Transposase DDE domain
MSPHSRKTKVCSWRISLKKAGCSADSQGDAPSEAARDRARQVTATNADVALRRERKKVEMLFAHLKRIMKAERLRLRGPCGARDEILLAATAQNLRRLANLIPPAAPAAA